MSSERAARDTTKGREESIENTEEEQDENTPEPKEQEDEQKSDESASESPEPASASASTSATPAPEQIQWQAIWAPQYNAYYFYNPVTQETTWSNPLQPDASSSAASASGSSPDIAAPTSTPTPTAAEDSNAEAGSSTDTPQPHMSAAAAHYAALQAAAVAQGIDPLLAHLDPTLVSSVGPGSPGVPGDVPTFKAQFNAHTGRFATADSRTPGHLSEYERAKRMSEFYFDVNKWEEDLAKRGGSLMAEEGEEGGDASGKKRKRPTKKDIERFKEQKRLKKIAKTAWLRT